MSTQFQTKFVRRSAAFIAAVCVQLLASSAAHAVVTITHTDSGWYDQSGSHSSGNVNYFCGDCGNQCSAGEVRNFFVFDLTPIAASILSAELRIFNPGPGNPGFQSPDPTETYELFDVATAVPTLRAGGSGLTTIFADLGTGTSYGSRVFSSADNGQTVTIPLNVDAVAALNAARGSVFALGGRLTTIILDSNIESVFAFSGFSSAVRELVLVTDCGNGTLDSGEECDDDNEADGDGCSQSCTVEECWSCSGEPSACTPLAVDTACDDGLFCTTTDTCNGAGTCAGSGDPCSGGAECNDACNELLDSCFNTFGSSCSSDGNQCTGDYCDGAGACIHPVESGSFCDDELFCNGTDFCDNTGACALHFDPPCTGPDGDADCAESCDESMDICGAPDPLGSPCQNDGLFCTGSEQCDGNGSCVSPGDPCPGPDGDADCVESCDEGADNCSASDGDGSACSDGDACTSGDQCTSDTCVSSGPTDCDDSDICTQDSCLSEVGCMNDPEPVPVCRDAGTSTLTMTQKDDDTKDRLSWRWSKGDATMLAELADPTTTADYALCIYDQTGLVASAEVPAAATCAEGNPCWKTRRGGFAYRDRSNANDGISSLALKEGTDAKARASMTGKGMMLPDPVLPLTGDVTVQLHNSQTGLCIGDDYIGADITKNEVDRFRAKHKEP